jgi:hypothetical protein
MVSGERSRPGYVCAFQAVLPVDIPCLDVGGVTSRDVLDCLDAVVSARGSEQ